MLRKFNCVFFVVVFLLMVFSGCQKAVPSQTRTALGTICTVSLYEEGSKKVYEEIFDRISQIENEMSPEIIDSDVYKINKASSSSAISEFEEPVTVSICMDTYKVLKTALWYANLSDGTFDPTIGALVNLWQINTKASSLKQESVPTDSQIEEARKHVNWRALELFGDADNYSATINQPGVQVDLGGIAKGYAADQIVEILKAHEISRAMIDLGGNIYAYGAKKDADENGKSEPWRVGIKNPDITSDGSPVATLSVIDSSVVTSGAYERFFEFNGKIYHHIIDPATGYPAESDMASSTIINSNSMLCDALSTACYIMGSEKAVKFLTKNAPKMKYCFVLKNGRILTNYEEIEILK